MCLYPILIKNPKYLPNKKNGYCPPKLKDERVKYVPIGCGHCMECRRQRANNWKLRLTREMENNPLKAYFVTLTFSDKSLNDLETKIQKGNKETAGNDSACAILGLKLWRERYRKKYKRSPRHWMVTEKGHTNTHRLHMHGIIWTEHDIEEVMQTWGYGFTYTGMYCNLKTVNYIVKYVLKIDNDNPDFEGRVLASPGIGDWNFKRSNGGARSRYRGRLTEERYRLPSGRYTGLPIYLRNKIYTEKQRELLWTFRLDKQERWVNGIRIDVRNEEGERNYLNVLYTQQIYNESLGFGKRKRYERDKYQTDCKLIKQLTIQQMEKAFEERQPILRKTKKQLYLQL